MECDGRLEMKRMDEEILVDCVIIIIRIFIEEYKYWSLFN